MTRTLFKIAGVLLALHFALVSIALWLGQAAPANILLYGNLLLDVEQHLPVFLLPHEQALQGASWSPDGQSILVTTAGATAEESAVWVMRANGRQRQFISDTGYQYGWSPDSQQIAYIHWRDQGNMTLQIYDIRTGESRWVLDYAAYGSDIVWSPDSRYITLTMRLWRRNRLIPDVWIVDAKTGAIIREFEFATTPVWSADNRWLAITRFAADERGIFIDQIPYVVNMSSGEAIGLNALLPPPISQVSGYEYTAAPDGHYLAVRVVTIVPQLHLLSVSAAGEWHYHLTLDNVRYPAWSPDGAWLKYEQYADGVATGYIMRPDGSEKQPFGTMPYSETGAYRPPVWSPDSRFLVSLRQGSLSYLIEIAPARTTLLCDCLAGNGQWKP